MIRKRYLILMLLLLGLVLALASHASAADELEIFAGQDKTVRVNVPLEFNDAQIIKPNPLDPERTYTFSWDFDNLKDISLDGIYDNDAESNERFTEWTYHIAGQYIVTLTVSDGFNTAKDTLKVTVRENSPPEIDILDSVQAFIGVPYTFWANATDDNAPPHLLRWHWEFGDGSSSDIPPPVTHTYGSVRGYQAKVRVTDPDNSVSERTIAVNVVEKPGEHGTLYPVKDGKIVHTNKQIREGGYIAYKLPVLPRHDMLVEVTTVGNSPPVAVLIFTSETAFLDYELGVELKWDDDLSHEDLDYDIKITWRADEDADYYVVIDNGYQTGGIGSLAGMATVDVTVQDTDHNNFWANIPIFVYFLIIIVVCVLALFIVGNKFLEMQASHKQKQQAIVATKVQKDQAVSSLRSFLDHPEDVTIRESQRARTPQPGPGGPPYPPGARPAPGPGMAPGPGGPPPQMRPTGAPGGPPPQMRPTGAPGGPPPQMGPTEAPQTPPPSEPPAEPPAPSEMESIPPVEEPTAPEDFKAPEMVSAAGPVYMETEQPKRESVEFTLKGDDETSEEE